MTQIKKIKQSAINRALRLHEKWLNNDDDGRRLVVTTNILNLINFSEANFSGADFNYANFSGANFSGANFSEAIFTSIHLNYTNTINTNGLTVISCQLNTSDENRSIQYWKKLGIVTAGCFSGTLDELKEAVDKTHKNNIVLYAKYQAVFEYIDTVLKIEGASDD